MRFFRSAAAIGIATRLYDEARQPQNRARIRAGVRRVRASRDRRRR